MQFLRGDLRGEADPVRPPWALPETVFMATCERCDDCLPACPEGILVHGRGGYPEVDFAGGGCTFCGDCVKRCRYGALHFSEDPGQRPWDILVDIRASCLSLNRTLCRSCGEVCEDQAIRFRLEVGGIARPVLDQEACSGCGACISPCPVGAIRVVRASRLEPLSTDRGDHGTG